MRAILYSAIVCAVATSSYAQIREAIPTFSIKDGETLVFRHVSSHSNCTPTFRSVEAVDMLEGSDELSFTTEPRPDVNASTTTYACAKPVPGVSLLITAKGVTEPKETIVTVRVRMDTTQGPWQNTVRARVLMFPATKPAAKEHRQEKQEMTQEQKQ